MYRNEHFEDVYYESLDSAEKLLYNIESTAEEDEKISRVLSKYLFIDNFDGYRKRKSYKDLVVLVRTGIRTIRKRTEHLNELFSVDASFDIIAALKAKIQIDKNTREIEWISQEELSETEEVDVRSYCEAYFDQLTSLNKAIRRYNAKYPKRRVAYVRGRPSKSVRGTDEVNWLLESIYIESHLMEMAYLGRIPTPGQKDDQMKIFMYNREFRYENPHVTLGLEETNPKIKVEIPPELPKSIDDFEVLAWKEIRPNNKLKKNILEWYNEEEDGVSNWRLAMMAWKRAIEGNNPTKLR